MICSSCRSEPKIVCVPLSAEAATTSWRHQRRSERVLLARACTGQGRALRGRHLQWHEDALVRASQSRAYRGWCTAPTQVSSFGFSHG
jgi:hypothetical protein